VRHRLNVTTEVFTGSLRLSSRWSRRRIEVWRPGEDRVYSITKLFVVYQGYIERSYSGVHLGAELEDKCRLVVTMASAGSSTKGKTFSSSVSDDSAVLSGSYENRRCGS
jgi:hypothetical protein